jgi:hypothetical protein
MSNQIINEEWERESLKDLIYLQELQMEIEKEFWEDFKRQPAQIVTITSPDKTQKDEEHNISEISADI